jgi:tripartite-type tricarboxylate transporter receptor subunit TctC
MNRCAIGLVAAPDLPEGAATFYIDLMKKTRDTPEWRSYEKRNDLVDFCKAGEDQRKMLLAASCVWFTK